MIELRSVTIGYDGKTVVRVDELSLSENRITVIVGKNGCGKSTLLRAIAGLLPYKGIIVSNGVEVADLSCRVRAQQISFLPQHLTSPDMRVETLVCHGRFSRMGFSKVLGRKDREAVTTAMEAADVDQLRHKMVSGLSGGERQRAYLAMTIAQEAPMMLLDEPDTYMDIAHRRSLAQILGKLKEQGKGIIMTSHDLPFAFLVADQICVMKSGQVTAVGVPDEIASKKELLRRAMGVGMKKVEEAGFLYPYMMEELP